MEEKQNIRMMHLETLSKERFLRPLEQLYLLLSMMILVI